MSKVCGSLKTTTTPPAFGGDDPPDYSLTAPVPTTTPPPPNPDVAEYSEWIQSPCKPDARYRYTRDGHIEVEGRGVLTSDVSEVAWKNVDRWRELIWKTADVHGISRAFLASVILTESGGISTAKSSAGALGLMQLMPDTARWLANPEFPKSGKVDVHEQTILNPGWNMTHGAKFLVYLLNQHQSNIVSTMASYNHGHVECATKPGCSEDAWGVWTNCGYVDKIIGNLNFAVKAGYSGPVQIDLGEGGAELTGSAVPSVLFGLMVGGAALWAYQKWGKKIR